jgi:hypothetical protein
VGVIRCYVSMYIGNLNTKAPETPGMKKRKESETVKRIHCDEANQPSNPSKSSEPCGHCPAASMPSEWESIERALSCMRACGVVEVARDETATGEVEGEEDGRGERGKIRRASVVQDLSGALSACNVDSDSAVQVRGLDVLSKILDGVSGCLGACWVGERIAGGA